MKDTLEAVLSEGQGFVSAGLSLGAPRAESSSLFDAQSHLLCTKEKRQDVTPHQ